MYFKTHQGISLTYTKPPVLFTIRRQVITVSCITNNTNVCSLRFLAGEWWLSLWWIVWYDEIEFMMKMKYDEGDDEVYDVQVLHKSVWKVILIYQLLKMAL